MTREQKEDDEGLTKAEKRKKRKLRKMWLT